MFLLFLFDYFFFDSREKSAKNHKIVEKWLPLPAR